MTVYVEPPDSTWAARQILDTALRKLGYDTALSGFGDTWRIYILR